MAIFIGKSPIKKYIGVLIMKKKFVILSVSALLSLVSLAGCGQTECPVCEEKPGEDNPGGDNPGTDNPGEDHPGTDEPGTDPEPEPDPSEGLIDEADSPWDEETTKLMMSSLGGGILPYVNLGEGALDAEFVKNDEDEGYRSYLKITGSSYLESSLDAAVTEYKDHYWDALMVGENFYATNDLLKVEVEVGKTYDGLFELKAFYNEPFDSSKVDSWDENTTKIMSEHLGRFTIPFVYLGTVNYETEVTAEGAILVTGGTWNDLVLAEFDNAFDGWEVTNPDMEDLTTTLATKTEENGNKVSVTLSKNSFGKAQVLISLEEAFDSTNQTAWSTEVLSAMDKSLNTNILPYVYLGTVYPTVDTANTSERNITIVGKLWEDSILTAAKKAFEKDSTLEGDETWEIVEDAENSSVTFTRDIGLELYTVVIGKNTDGVPTLQASREEGYHPESLTDYTDEIKASLQAKFGEEVSLIPYIYLGTASPRIDEDLSAAVNGDNKIVIRGGKYDERILTQFTEQFASQNGQNGWYIATDCFEDRPTGSVETDGEVLVVALKNTGKHTYKVGLFTLGSGDSKTVYLEITRANNTGAGASEWSAESLTNLKTVLGSDVTIPHFEMGKDSAEIIFNDYGQLEIDFSSANLDTHSYYMWCLIDALNEAKWNVALGHVKTYYHKDAWLSNVHAEKTFGTKKVSIDIDMHQSSYYGFFIDGIITSVEEYDSAKETGTWNDAVKQEVKDRVGLDLPYVYLGTDNPYAFYDEDDEVLKIYGNATSDRLYENENTILTNAGYTIYDYEPEYHYIVAETKNEAGNIVTITIEDDDDRPCISFEYTEVFNPGDRTEWDADTKDFLEKELPTGVKLPYMYLGKERTAGSILATFLYPLFVKITALITQNINLNYEDTFLIIIFAGVIGGLANGFIYKTGFSNGGLPIISQILDKYFKIPVTKSSMVINSIIIVIGSIFFQGLRWISLLLIVGIVALAKPWIPRASQRSVKRMLKKIPTWPKILSGNTYINEDGLYRCNGLCEMAFYWKHLSHTIVGQKGICVFAGNRIAAFLPAEYFSGKQEMLEMSHWMQQQIEQNKKQACNPTSHSV